MASTAPYHDYGLLATTLQWIRIKADEPAGTDARFSDTLLSHLLSEALDQTLADLYSQTQSPPCATFPVTVVAGQQYYTLPPNCQEIRRVAKITAATGLQEWALEPDSPKAPWGPGIIFDGLNSFQLVPIPTEGGDILTVEYVPGGHQPWHQNATPLFDTDDDAGSTTADADSLQLLSVETTGWFLGKFDRRPDAYVGHTLRLLGTVNDKYIDNTIPWFPIQERIISAYDVDAGLAVTVHPDFDAIVTGAGSDWTDWLGIDKVKLQSEAKGRTYLIYEVVPNVDPGIMGLAAIEVVIELLTQQEKSKKLALYERLRERKKRALLQRWASHQTIVPPTMDTLQASLEDFFPL